MRLPTPQSSAASIGYEMQPNDFAMRCNIITLADGRIKNHHGGHLKTEDGDTLIKYLDEKLGNENIKFINFKNIFRV